MAGSATLRKPAKSGRSLEHKAVPVSGFKVLDEEQGIVSAIVSVTGVVDEVQDNILPGAYAKTLAALTPKGCWSHDWDVPISKTVDAVELMPGDPRLPAQTAKGEPWPTGAGGLLVEMQFNTETQRGRESLSDVKFYGDEAQWSIGYKVPVGGAKIDRKTGVREISEIELFEYSPVLFGAMPLAMTTDVKTAQEALRKAAEKPHDYRGDDGQPCAICGEPYDHEMHIGSPKWEAMKDEEDAGGESTSSAEKPEGEKADEPTETKKAIASHTTETSTATWDGPAQEANLSNDDGASVYRKAFAWVDPEGDADVKSSYKFIHHFVSDGAPGAASTTACSTGIGVLNGGRGGTNIPEDDVSGVYAHLSRHLKDADMEPPELKIEPDPEVKQDASPGIGTDSPTGTPIQPQFGRVGGLGDAPSTSFGPEALGTVRVVENHASCPADRSFGVVAGDSLLACSATREEAEAMVGASKAAAEALRKEAVRTAQTAGERTIEAKGVPVAEEGANEAEATSYALYGAVCDLTEELDSGLDALAGAIGQADLDAANALWTAVDLAADALLAALGVADTDDLPTGQALSGDGWNPECDPGSMAQAADACVDLGLDAWNAGNLAQAAALAFAADCAVDELMDWFGLDDDDLLVVPASYYDEWAAALPEEVKAGKLEERLAALRERGTKEGRVLSGSNASDMVDAVGKLISILDAAGVTHPWTASQDAGNEPEGGVPGTGGNSAEPPAGTQMTVETVPAETSRDSLKGSSLGEVQALLQRAKSLRSPA